MESVIPVLFNAAISAGVSYLLAPSGQNSEGPRLQDLGVQTTSYGSVIKIVYGTALIGGVLIWLLNDELTETRHKESTGKGGGGSITTFSYSAKYGVAIHDGEIDTVKTVWADNVIVHANDYTGLVSEFGSDAAVIAATNADFLGIGGAIID